MNKPAENVVETTIQEFIQILKDRKLDDLVVFMESLKKTVSTMEQLITSHAKLIGEYEKELTDASEMVHQYEKVSEALLTEVKRLKNKD